MHMVINEQLEQMENDRLPHITWCPTGKLAHLPLHAAGIYKDPFGPRVFDFVVSSYTPSLTAFIHGRDGVARRSSVPKVLLVTQPETPEQSPLPGTAKERATLLKVYMKSEILRTIIDTGNTWKYRFPVIEPNNPE